jgi:ubiquinone/menaquinone biosynthesis C-methylase UbiE
MGLGINQSNSKMIVHMAKIKTGDKVLDVGCGSGNLTLTAKRYVGQSGSVNGIDASPEMIDVARKNARQTGINAIFDVALIEKLPFSDWTFDVVISRLVMHHLPDDLKQQALAEIFRVLKPGGTIFLADFQTPTNPILARLISLLIGHPAMTQSKVSNLIPVLARAGFDQLASGQTRSVFMGFASSKKPQDR